MVLGDTEVLNSRLFLVLRRDPHHDLHVHRMGHRQPPTGTQTHLGRSNRRAWPQWRVTSRCKIAKTSTLVRLGGHIKSQLVRRRAQRRAH